MSSVHTPFPLANTCFFLDFRVLGCPVIIFDYFKKMCAFLNYLGFVAILGVIIFPALYILSENHCSFLLTVCPSTKFLELEKLPRNITKVVKIQQNLGIFQNSFRYHLVSVSIVLSYQPWKRWKHIRSCLVQISLTILTGQEVVTNSCRSLGGLQTSMTRPETWPMCFKIPKNNLILS